MMLGGHVVPGSKLGSGAYKACALTTVLYPGSLPFLFIVLFQRRDQNDLGKSNGL